jgi:hypothetical protein
MVVLMGRYSNFPQPLLSGQTDRLFQVADVPEPSKSPTPRVHAVQRRLSPHTIQQLITDYQTGTPSTQLAKRYGFSKGAVLRLLGEQSIPIRRQSMTTADIRQATQLYQAGNSLVAVGAKLGYDHGTIQRALRRAGTAMRDSHGREQVT